MKHTYTEEYIFKCLKCCEEMINKNLYLAQKWKNSYITPSLSAKEHYQAIAKEWIEYRTIIRSLLESRYSTKEIINLSNIGKKTTQKNVKALVAQIEDGDYIECVIDKDCLEL